MSEYTEDALVQTIMADYLHDHLGWRSVYAYNQETFGPGGLLGRNNDREVVLTLTLHGKLKELNPGFPEQAYSDALRQITETIISQSMLTTNQEKYELLLNGVAVSYRTPEGEQRRDTLRVFDFAEPQNNDFLCVREMWIRGDLYRRRADIIGFVNGIPLLFVECKNVHKDLEVAYRDNLADYRDTIPHLFHHNAIVMLTNGIEGKIGTITSQYNHFAEWKRLEEKEAGVVAMETMLKGVCEVRNFMDLIENFIVFDSSTGRTAKILARNHQFLGVNRAVEAVRQRAEREGKLGVFWHTQGSGKSYSMLFFTRKVHRRLGGNFTFIVLTDRDDLDGQIYKTFAGCGVVNNNQEPCRAINGRHLEELLGQHKKYVFSLIQKFNKNLDEKPCYSERDDVIVITDEAHRTQYGTLSLNLRDALPNASYIGFTGTPLFSDDEITRRVFGEYISTYDFKRAVDDGATVPLYYDARGELLGIATTDLNERIAEKLEEIELDDINQQQRLEQALKQDYHVITAKPRLEQIAGDFVEHYSRSWESGKAMLVCIDKITCVRMYDLIAEGWQNRIKELKRELKKIDDQQESLHRQRQIDWMTSTQMAVVISEEQGEIAKFKQWGLDIQPHRRLIKQGFEIPVYLRDRPEFMVKHRLDVDSAFKEAAHPFRIVIVCAMWLTGFDVPCLSTLYLDKPLKAHTLMQAIARANRVHEGKNNGLIVDYCGILKNLRKALATFTGQGSGGEGEGGGGGTDPTHPIDELLRELEEAIGLVRSFLDENGASLDDVRNLSGFLRNAAILSAKEAANENDETRKRFEIMCRAVFSKFKACINTPRVNAFRSDRDAINVIYNALQEDKQHSDISDIIRQLHEVVEEVIDVKETGDKAERERAVYDISKIDFDILRQEFEQSPRKKTTVQGLRTVIEERLKRMLEQNPMRTDMQAHYEKIIAEYNSEKSRVTIEQTFEALLRKAREMDQEEDRAVREGLTEESLAIFDLLKKPELKPGEILRIKAVSTELLEVVKRELTKIHHWRDKESARDSVQSIILNFLYDDKSGLPESSYATEEVNTLTTKVYSHIYRAYPTIPSPFYAEITPARRGGQPIFCH
ncbi:MAG: type I restriction endonuclease subunit R [Kiritimatiellae bacterium]|nr:type I restriction endonuclease subunit R [Kiritimatiellia bacterium]